MHRWITVMMKRWVIMGVSICLILIWGGISAYQMDREYLPPINNTTLMISVRADHYQADQVKDGIAGPLRQAISQVDGLESVEMSSYSGGLLCSLYYPFRFDMEKAERDVASALAGLSVPDGVQKPVVTRVSTNSFPMMRLSLLGDSSQVDENTLRTTVQSKVAQQLRMVPGVHEVRILGGAAKGWIVTVRTEDLKKNAMSMEDVKRSLSSLSLNWPQGDLASEGKTIPIRVTGGSFNRAGLEETPIVGSNRKIIPLSSVANVSSSLIDLQTISRTDGKPSVILDVFKSSTANITQVSNRMQEEISSIQSALPSGVKLSLLYDRAQDLNHSLAGLIREGLLGCLFSMVSVFLFLRNARATFVIALSLPICLLTTTAILKFMGISLNILTVSGLIVAMGRVVDDSIVILDNMYRKVENHHGKVNLQHLSAAVHEMLPAIISSTATTIAVFLPISLVGGIIEASFSAFAWSVMIALVVSLFVSILVVPTMTFLGWRDGQVKTDPLQPIMSRVLTGVFPRRKWVISLCVALLVLTTAVALILPVNVLPTSGQGMVSIQVALPEDATMATVNSEVKKAEDVLKSDPQVETFSTTLGSSYIPQFDDVFDDGGGWIQSAAEANITVKVKSNVDIYSFVSKMQTKLRSIASVAIFTVTNQNLSGDDTQLKVVLTGADPTILDQAARVVRSKLQLVPGLSVDGAAGDHERSETYQFALNEPLIRQSGINIQDVLNRMGLYLSQGVRVEVTRDGQPIPLLLNTDKNEISAKTGKNALTMLSEEAFLAVDGKTITLQQLLSPTGGAALSVYRDKDGKPFALVSAKITARDLEKVNNQALNVLKGLTLPSGVNVSVGGVSERLHQMIEDAAVTIAISFILVLLIVCIVFRGWRAPVCVLICIPLSLIGSIWGMFLFGKEWNLAAFLGMLMLIGIVVTNGIVLVDKIERNFRSGLTLDEAVWRGTLSRVRPVFMTALTTILTLLPLAFSSSADTVISQTLGIVVVGGMLSSTTICLVLIPLLYHWLNQRKITAPEFERLQTKAMV